MSVAEVIEYGEKSPVHAPSLEQPPIDQAAFLDEEVRGLQVVDSDTDPSKDFLTEFTESLSPEQQTVLFYMLERPDEQIPRRTMVDLLEGASHNARNNKFTRFLYQVAKSPFGESIYTTRAEDRSRVYWFQEDRALQEGEQSLFEVNGVVKPYGPRTKELVDTSEETPLPNFESFATMAAFLDEYPDSRFTISTPEQMFRTQQFLKYLHQPRPVKGYSGEDTSVYADPDEHLTAIYDRCNKAIVDYMNHIDAEIHTKRRLAHAAIKPNETVVALEPEERSWQDYANCMGVDPDLFFPDRGASTREARECCRGCVVREDCLEYALTNGEKFGIWGGRSERERRRMRRQRKLARRVGAAVTEQETAVAIQ